jgi:hypothetical protein
MDIWERIRFARDQALTAEETERQRIADADTQELQRAASVRLATRQAVREALDDVLDERSEPAKGRGTTSGEGQGSEQASGEGTGPATSEGGEPASGEGSEPAHSPGTTSPTAGAPGSHAPIDAGSVDDPDAESPLVPDPPPVPGTPTIPDIPTPEGAEDTQGEAVHGLAAEPAEGLASDVQEDPETQVSG